MSRTQLPLELLRLEPPVLRPRDATWWAHPAKELGRLARAGVILNPDHGTYVVPPPPRMGDPEWRPTLEGFALAFGQRLFGQPKAALMGISAARLAGVWPRAVRKAVVAVPVQRRAIETTWGDVQFVTRALARLDLVRQRTDLGEGWRTSDEQTLLDAADRPPLFLGANIASEVIAALAVRVDWETVTRLAAAQRKRAAHLRARWLATAIPGADRDLPPPPSRPRTTVPSLGLRPLRPVDPRPFGIIEGHRDADH